MSVIKLTLRNVKDAFTRKLEAEQDDQRDHIFYYLDYEGSQYTVGKLSHSWSGSLDDTQISMLAHELCLTKREFERWVICHLSNSDMITIWRQRRRERYGR